VEGIKSLGEEKKRNFLRNRESEFGEKGHLQEATIAGAEDKRSLAPLLTIEIAKGEPGQQKKHYILKVVGESYRAETGA